MNSSNYILNTKLLTSDRDRFFNCVLDFVFIVILIILFSFLVVIIGNIFQINSYNMWIEIVINLGVVATYLSFAIIYYLFFESIFGRTMGKLLTGSIVVNEHGLKPDFATICKRTLCRLIPFDALSFLGKSEMFWHDSISKTYVVEKQDLKKDMDMFYNLNLIGKRETN